MIHKIRKTKVGSKRSVRVTIPDVDMPWFSFAGIWIKRAGFKTGDPCEIMVHRRKLIIRKI